MIRKVKWGILSTAGIATRRVIPAMQSCEFAEITAISSRSLSRAKSVATSFSIPKAYGSYEELLADPEIEIIYNPLPNHLHAEWTLKAARKGKHVLCEKPIAMNVAEARKLLEGRDEWGVKIGEAFMVRTHPQWLRTRELIGSGRAGQSMHLMPVLGAVLAVVFLGERFHLYHAVGIALIAAGIVLASFRPRPLQ